METAKNVRVIPANPLLTLSGKVKSNKERLAAYCRVSTDDADQLNSYATQMQYYETKIHETDGWIMVGIYADEGISGTSIKKRTNFNRMIAACRAGKIDRILCKSISRFARNTVDCLNTVRDLKALDVAVYFEKENIDTLLQQSEFMITLFSSFAQAESESLSANVRMGMRMAMAQGKVSLRVDRLMGYEINSEGIPVIEETGARTVRRIYISYLTGASFGQIARELEEEKLPTASGTKEWSRASVQNILTNERYIGDALLQKSYIQDCLSKKRRKNNGEVAQYYVENNHKGIISHELFNRVQEEIARRRNKRRLCAVLGERVKGKYSAKFALTEKLICGECGTHYRRCTWTASGTKRVVWRCISRLEHGKKYCHTSSTIDEYKIHQGILSAINSVVRDKEDIIKTLKLGAQSAFSKGKGGVDALTLSLRLKDLEMIKNKLLDDALEDCKTSAQIESEFQDNLKEMEVTTALLKEHEQEQAASEEQDARIKEMFDIIEKMPNILDEYDDTLVRQIITNVTVMSKFELSVRFEFGIEIKVGI